jgi:hypothetical protein
LIDPSAAPAIVPLSEGPENRPEKEKALETLQGFVVSDGRAIRPG